MKIPSIVALVATVSAAMVASVGLASADTPLTLAGSYSGSGSGTSISTSCTLDGNSSMSIVAGRNGDTGGGLGPVDWQMSQTLTVGPQAGLPHSQPTGPIVSLDSFSMHLSGASASATVTVQPPFLGQPTHTDPAVTCWDFRHQDFSSHEIHNFSFYVEHSGAEDTDVSGFMHSADYSVPYQAAIYPTSSAAILESGSLIFSCDDETFQLVTVGVGFGGCFLTFVAHSQQPLDSTPPAVTGIPDRQPDLDQWYSSDVTIDWQATDDSGSASDPPDTIATQEGSHTYTSGPSCDPSNNCATGSITLSIDKTPPVVSRSATANGLPYSPGTWTRYDVVIQTSCADPGGSGIKVKSADQTVATEGSGQAIDGVCVDRALNSSTASFDGIQIDKTPPSIAIASPADGATYSQGQTVNATYSCSDGLSGVASCQGPVANGAVIDTSNGVHTFTVTATDAVGNQSSSSATYTVVSQLSSKTTTCNGYFTGSGKDVIVPAGAVCHLLPGTTANHDVTVQSGGTLIAGGISVGHDLSMTGAAGGSVCASNVAHDMTVTGSAAGSSAVVVGDTAAGCSSGNTVGHDLTVSGNAGPVVVGNNSVSHDLTVRDNTGGATVRSNSAGHDASCLNNNPQSGAGNSGGHGNTCPA